MKNTTLSAIFLFLLILFSNCSDDNPDNNQPDDVLSLSVENISFDALGEKKSFKITSNSKWEIEKKSSGSWYTVTPDSGEGDAEITIDADENLESKEQQDKLNVKTKTATISLKQAAAVLYYPLLSIKTDNNAPIDSKETYINATITIRSRDVYGVLGEKILEEQTQIRGRGNSTWGMPKNKHWVMLANYSDKNVLHFPINWKSAGYRFIISCLV